MSIVFPKYVDALNRTEKRECSEFQMTNVLSTEDDTIKILEDKIFSVENVGLQTRFKITTFQS
jgi:hypothetical protein